MKISTSIRVLALILICAGLSGCEDPQIYGSVGVSSYGGGGYYGYGGPRYGSSVGIGGRIH
jgi:hypothetical protein